MSVPASPAGAPRPRPRARPAAPRRRPGRRSRRGSCALRAAAAPPAACGRRRSAPTRPRRTSPGSPGAVDERDHPLPGPDPRAPLPIADVDLPEPAQVPLDVVQVQLARLVDPQPHLGHQLRGRVVPGGRGELAACRQLAAPPGEQHPDLGLAGRDPQRGVLAAPRPVHLIDRARHDPSRSSGGSRPCAAVPGTGNRSSAPAPGPAGCPLPRRAAPARSRRPRRRAASSHSGRPSHARTCSRWITSPAMVLSARPAAARARTSPASVSVSNAASSSGAAGARSSRRSRTTASPTRVPTFSSDDTPSVLTKLRH